DLVDRGGAGRIWESRAARGLTRRGLTLAGGQDAAHQHFIHMHAINPGAPRGLADDGRAELGRGERRQLALESAERRPHGRGDDDRILLSHSVLLFRNVTSRPASSSLAPK